MLSYSRDSPHFAEPEAALPFLQLPATCSYPEYKNSVQFPPHSLFDMSLNFLFMVTASKWSLFFMIPQRNSTHITLISLVWHKTRTCRGLLFDHPNKIWLKISGTYETWCLLFFPQKQLQWNLQISWEYLLQNIYSFFKQSPSLLTPFFTFAREFVCRWRKCLCCSVVRLHKLCGLNHDLGKVRENKFNVQNPAGKILASVFWENERILVVEFLKRGV